MKKAIRSSMSSLLALTLFASGFAPVFAEENEVVSAQNQTELVPKAQKFEILTQPVSLSAKTGQTVSFQVEASGEGLTYRWQYKTSRANSSWYNSGLKGSNTSCLEVQGTEARNGQQYRCLITDPSGNTLVSETALLSVEKGIAVRTEPQDQQAITGDKATFAIEAEGIDLIYQWQYRKNEKASWSPSSLEGNKTSVLTVPAAASRNGQQYRCIIQDPFGNKFTSQAASLTVMAGVTLQEQPVSQEKMPGESAVFHVSAQGSNLRYQWQFKRNERAAWTNSGLAGNTTDTMEIPAIESRNGQMYRCVVTDSLGNKAISETAVLTVTKPIVITSQPEDHSASAGQKSEFHVGVEGTDYTCQWQYRKNEKAAWSNSTMEGSKTDSLYVVAAKDRNGQQYRCKITHKNGYTLYTNTVTMTVLTYEPASIVTQPTDQSAPIGKTVSFHVEAKGAGLSYQWQYRKNEKSGWLNSGLSGSTTDTLQVPVIASRDGQQYRCRITDANKDKIYTDAVRLSLPEIPMEAALETDVTSVKTTESSYVITFTLTANQKPDEDSWKLQLNGQDTSCVLEPKGKEAAGYIYSGTYTVQLEDGLQSLAFSAVGSVRGNLWTTKEVQVEIEKEKEVPAVEMTLRSNENRVSKDASSAPVTFYVETNVDPDDGLFTLIDPASDLTLGWLYDDGLAEHGDEKAGDGIYSVIVDLNTGFDEELLLSAWGSFHEETLFTNTVTIAAYQDYTEEDLEIFENVETEILSITSAENFEELLPEVKAEIVEKELEVMEETGLIAPSSILVSENSSFVSFTYNDSNLTPCVIDVTPIELDEDNESLTFSGSLPQATSELLSLSPVEMASYNQNLKNSYSELSYSIYYAADNTTTSKNYKYFKEMERKLQNLGVKVNFDNDVTVDDFRHFNGDVNLMVMHGSYLDFPYKTGSDFGAIKWIESPGYHLIEEVTPEKDRLYQDDLRSTNIIKVYHGGEASYVVLADFFENQYNPGDLDEQVILACCCQSMGLEDVFTTKMADAFLGRGASVYVGFHNSVKCVYANGFLDFLSDCLLRGTTIGKAFDVAIAEQGENDGGFIATCGLVYPPATPYLNGNKDKKLVALNMKNGSFEEEDPLHEWQTTGNTQVISSLGSLKAPDGSNMVFMTTGPGSECVEDEYRWDVYYQMSTLKQTIQVPETVTTLSFDYDFLYEDPYRHITQYNDKLVFRILNSYGDDIDHEDVMDICTFNVPVTQIKDIDLGGEVDPWSPTKFYHTGFRTFNRDVTAYQGKTITFEFYVIDYDEYAYVSAALIDNIRLQ